MFKKNYNVFVLVILVLILVINLFSFFKKDNALKLETLKVGGPENMELVTKLYQSQEYIDQQTAAIDQALAQINMMNTMTEEEINQMMMEQTNQTGMMVEWNEDQMVIEWSEEINLDMD